jgi:hypothetical protein
MSNKPGWLTTAFSLCAEVRRESLVTGGKGTIASTYKGQTYYSTVQRQMATSAANLLAK